ncbi:MAG: acetolactate decarboxylase [Deltaproteobacteria bacterium]|nr:acetolactate decarboxylase [Deltaproteobacteria bacterium]
MKKRFLLFFAIILPLFAGCTAIHSQNTVTQVSTIDALLAGVYDGQMSCGELKKYGNTGIGTFDHLDGEMILLNGAFYQVKSDGKVYEPPKALTTPFAAVCRFSPDETVGLNSPITYDELKKLLDERVPNQNLFCTFKIVGRFRNVRARSVPAQKKPYPPLAKVTAQQPEFTAKDIGGTIVGFRCPPFVKGINVPGYHLHFLSDSKKFGGHLLAFEMEKGLCAVDICNQFVLILPENLDLLKSVDLSKDRSKELERVEQ